MNPQSLHTAHRLAAIAAAAAAPALFAGPDVLINEIRTDQTGIDNDEYFELTGAAATSLDGLTYLVIGDGASKLGSGVVEEVIDLTGQSLDDQGFFVAAESTFTLGTADLTTSLNFENSDNVTHVLVEGFTGAAGDDLDTNDDGELDTMPWTVTIDAIGLVEEPNPPTATEFVYGEALGFVDLGPDGPFVPGHAFRCTPDGVWIIGIFDTADPDATDTPGAPNPECGKDSDGDGVPDFLDNCPDHPNPDQADCDDDGVGDVCAIAEGMSEDCNENSIPDDCEVDQMIVPDCNGNGVPDDCDLADGTLTDADGDGVPDECEVVAPTGLIINEIRIDEPGLDIDEYFELKGTPSTPLQGLRYLVIGEDDPALGSGVIEAVVNLDSTFVGLDGLYLAVEDTFTLGSILDADLILSSDDEGLNFENSDNVTHLLVANFIAGVGTDLDTDDDGVIDVTPWTDLLDAVGLIEERNPPAGTEYSYGEALGFQDVGPDDIFVPGHIYRCEPSGTWTIGLFDPLDPAASDTPGQVNVECEKGRTCPEDIDGDDSVGFTDLLAILDAWGLCPGCAADIDGDGSVGFTDLLAVLNAWGPCPAP